MQKFEKLTLPNEGEIITFNQGNPNVPNNPIVPFAVNECQSFPKHR